MAPKHRTPDLLIENAKLQFRNFSGKPGDFNPAGRRNFCVFLDRDLAEKLKSDGWNVKYLKPRDPDENPQAYLQVAISYEHVPPKIVLITKKNKTLLKEDDLPILDWCEIASADVLINPYHWEYLNKTGLKAYAKDVYITIVEDLLAEKYADVPDSAMSSIEDD
jgi:hypothetical protein